jgi:Zn-dependent protease/predicted transcriptional regulator
MAQPQPEPTQRNAPRPASPWSIRIATVGGIPVRIHLTFLLLLAWIGVLAYRQESRVFALLLPAIFFCVVLHELGHALVAKAFGIGTRDITLYPIGGVAMLEGRPKPVAEFWIALAGPAVNVAIALVIGIAYFFATGKVPSVLDGWGGSSFFEGLYAANVLLPVFNMIPAFPMDGGRVLRSFLAMFMPEVRATEIAGGIGQFFAMLMGFYGLLSGNILFVLIAFFVFMGAGQEVQMYQGLSLISGRRVEEAMMTRFRTIEHGQDLAAASRMLLEGSQACFPVLSNGEVVGLLTRENIVRGLTEEGPSAYVAGYMQREFPIHQVHEPLEKVLEGGDGSNRLPALVYSDGRLAGILSSDNFGEFLMVRQALKEKQPDV